MDDQALLRQHEPGSGCHVSKKLIVLTVHLLLLATPADMRPGQGLYPPINGTQTVRNCDNSSYGPANRTYGLTPAPCVECEHGLVARLDMGFAQSNRYFVRHADGAGGFVSAQACVALPGEREGGVSLQDD